MGDRMYLLINGDNTLNFVGEHPIDNRLCFEGVTLIERHEHTIADIMGDIPFEIAAWDSERQQVIIDPFYARLEHSNHEETET